jgi:hypothetical protein
MKKLAMFMFTLCAIAAAQTLTYDLSGEVCNSVGPEGCTFHFSDGSYWATGQSVRYVFQVPGAIEQSGYFCSNPTSGTWTQTVPNPVPLGTPVTFTFGCTATLINANQTVQMSAALRAHSHQESFPCEGRVRTTCKVTHWVVDSGFLMIGPPPPPQSARKSPHPAWEKAAAVRAAQHDSSITKRIVRMVAALTVRRWSLDAPVLEMASSFTGRCSPRFICRLEAD